MTETDKTSVVALAILLGPAVVLNRVIFIVENNSAVLRGKYNEFYNFTDVSHVIAAAKSGDKTIVVEGAHVDITKIMVCEEYWFHEFFLNPIEREKRKERKIGKLDGKENIPEKQRSKKLKG